MFAMNTFYLTCTLSYCILTIVYDIAGMNYYGTLYYNIVNAI
jgi:hypothetical protein